MCVSSCSDRGRSPAQPQWLEERRDPSAENAFSVRNGFTQAEAPFTSVTGVTKSISWAWTRMMAGSESDNSFITGCAMKRKVRCVMAQSHAALQAGRAPTQQGLMFSASAFSVPWSRTPTDPQGSCGPNTAPSAGALDQLVAYAPWPQQVQPGTGSSELRPTGFRQPRKASFSNENMTRRRFNVWFGKDDCWWVLSPLARRSIVNFERHRRWWRRTTSLFKNAR